jgi:processive 1,2-diacylglycerol beta-glucosyltransferase
MSNTDPPPTIKTLVAYSADPWDSALPWLRYRGPAQAAGLTVIAGNQGPQVDPERVAQADAVIIQRDFPRFVEPCAQVMREARQQNKPVIYEIDDLLPALPEDHISWPGLSWVLHPLLWTAVEADCITASTSRLRTALLPLNPNIQVLPNYLDDRLWPFSQPAEKEANASIVIGYMGGQTHAADLEMIAPVLKRMLDAFHGQVTLRFWGASPPAGLGQSPAVEWLPLEILDYPEFVRIFSSQTCDIAIAPLASHPFNQAKSAIKFLEYSALGMPGVYSRLEPYESVVVHGENGFLARTEEEWFEALQRLITDPGLRTRIARQAQQTVQQNWLLSRHAHEWPQTYMQTLNPLRKRQEARLERIQIVAQAARQAQARQLALEREQARLSQELEDRRADARFYQERYQDALQEIQFVRAQLEEIHHSRSWQLIQKTQQLRQRLVPTSSRREELFKKLGLFK